MPPNAQNGTVPPRRQKNTERRGREYLTPREVEHLADLARKKGRQGHRDATMILVAYRHGLRVSELCALRWDQADLTQGLLHVRRRKNGHASVQPLQGVTIRALRKLQRLQADKNTSSPYMFTTSAGAPITEAGFRKMFSRRGQQSEITFPVHPHMLRHATGFKLANDGQDTRAIQLYLGHKNIRHTTVYTELSPDRFRGFWED